MTDPHDPTIPPPPPPEAADWPTWPPAEETAEAFKVHPDEELRREQVAAAGGDPDEAEEVARDEFGRLMDGSVAR